MQTLATPQQEADKEPMQCFKCEGSMTNKKGTKPCKRCGGKGVLSGDFFTGLNNVIQAQIAEYCQKEYKGLLADELAQTRDE